MRFLARTGMRRGILTAAPMVWIISFQCSCNSCRCDRYDGAVVASIIGSRLEITRLARLSCAPPPPIMPSIGALFASLPDPVLGALFCTLFGMITAVDCIQPAVYGHSALQEPLCPVGLHLLDLMLLSYPLKQTMVTGIIEVDQEC
ncbi:solute carrier family 23 member 2 isoform X1 [Lates japonicus]|uniref:Solute carrier family 23 member 2 isoform X1 n=1 Tax=Lates japonicus TaxID=270547 RepID=A0AAD3RP61_LATJO|nr:solute carrier family 23 member 2 isoform X1 [Lates japonicus]